MSLIIKDNTRVLNSSMSHMDFYLALTQNRQDDAKFIIQNGLDLNLPNNYNRNTAIFTGVCANNIEIVEFLINYGANIHHKNAFGDTALHAALVLEYFDLALLLFHHGLMIAVENNKLNYVQQLIFRNANVNLQNLTGKTALHIAIGVLNTNFDIINKLLKYGANPTIKSFHNGNTPIEEAILQGREDIANYIKKF
jgi:ankyrin repeat protein